MNAIESTTSLNKASNANASKELGNKFSQVLENILFAETKDVEDPSLKEFIRFAFILCVFEEEIEISFHVRD